MGLTQQEALDLFQSDDLIGIGMAAMEVRRKKSLRQRTDVVDFAGTARASARMPTVLAERSSIVRILLSVRVPFISPDWG